MQGAQQLQGDNSGLGTRSFNEAAVKRPLTSQASKMTKHAGHSGTVAMQGTRIHSGANSTQIASVLETNTLDQHSKPIKITNPNMD